MIRRIDLFVIAAFLVTRSALAFVPSTVTPTKTTAPLSSTRSPAALHRLPSLSLPSSSTRLHAIHDAKKVQTAMSSNNALRGKLLILVSKLCVEPEHYRRIGLGIVRQTYWPEIVGIAAVCKAVSIGRWTYAKRRAELLQDDDNDDDDNKLEKQDQEGHAKRRAGSSTSSSTTTQFNAKFTQAFTASNTYKIARLLEQVGWLQAALYASDVVFVVLKLLGFSFVTQYQAPQKWASILLALWAARNVSRLKHYYLKRSSTSTTSSTTTSAATTAWNGEQSAWSGSSSSSSMMHTWNRIADILIYATAFFHVVDQLGMPVGFALKSIFGLGSFGTLSLSLASKDLAAEFVGGVMIQTSNFFNEGEMVVLQDGTRGSVAKIGWLHTYIYKQEENSIVRVPNSQISHQRIARARREPSKKRGRRTF